MNAAFQSTKNKDSGYSKMDFIKDFPKSQTAKKFNQGKPIPGFSYKKNLKNSYEPYELVLNYVLSEGHADSVEEAHYVMTQMDEETIKAIINEIDNLGGKTALATMAITGAALANPVINAVKNVSGLIKRINAGKNKTLDKIKP